MKPNRSHSGKTPGGDVTSVPPHPKFRPRRPSLPHPQSLRTTDHPPGPRSRKRLAPEKIFYPVQKNRAIPGGSGGQPSRFPPARVSGTSTAGPMATPGAGWSQGPGPPHPHPQGREGVHFARRLAWSQIGGIDCHVMLHKAKVGDSSPSGEGSQPSKLGASFPPVSLTDTLAHPPRGAGQPPAPADRGK